MAAHRTGSNPNEISDLWLKINIRVMQYKCKYRLLFLPRAEPFFIPPKASHASSTELGPWHEATSFAINLRMFISCIKSLLCLGISVFLHLHEIVGYIFTVVCLCVCVFVCVCVSVCLSVCVCVQLFL